MLEGVVDVSCVSVRFSVTLALSPSLLSGPAARRREFPSASASAKGALPQGTPETWTSVARDIVAFHCQKGSTSRFLVHSSSLS